MKEKAMTEDNLIQHSKKWDRTGILVATLCLIHCLAFPLLVVLLPATKSIFHNEIFELIIFSLGIVVGSISFFTSYKKHGIIQPMFIGLIGVGFLMMSLASSFTHSHSETQFSYYTILGGTLLIIGHLWNIRACACYCEKTCEHNHHH